MPSCITARGNTALVWEHADTCEPHAGFATIAIVIATYKFGGGRYEIRTPKAVLIFRSIFIALDLGLAPVTLSSRFS
jgi:hypothetical protein